MKKLLFALLLVPFAVLAADKFQVPVPSPADGHYLSKAEVEQITRALVACDKETANALPQLAKAADEGDAEARVKFNVLRYNCMDRILNYQEPPPKDPAK